MLFERITSEGLAHHSYLVGSNGEAVVIDPRRDAEVYVRRALRSDHRIVGILETHRNEDYLIGSPELAARTGAPIWHADAQLDYRYGEAVQDGQRFDVGDLRLEALHTPGHTPGLMSYLLFDAQGVPVMVFTGDCLFAGDVGRVDLAGPHRIEELAARQYDSIFRRLLPLGDGVIVCPAHGAGSVCGGSGMVDRPYTTLGIEREHNPQLQDASREAFIARVAVQREVPPYFRRMEELNVAGPPLLGRLPVPAPLSADAFAGAAEEALVLDTREAPAYNAAHLPGSISIWADGLASFAGWFLPYDRPLLLIEGASDPMASVRVLVRLGYDDIAGYLAGGLRAWHTAGRDSRATVTATAAQFCRMVSQGGSPWILDVRPQEEIEKEGAVRGAHQLHVTQIERHADQVPHDRPVFIFCESGRRSTMAGSVLCRQDDRRQLSIVLGGYRGLAEATCSEALGEC